MQVTVLSYDIKCDSEGNYPPIKEYLIQNFSYRQTTTGKKSMIAMPNSTLMKYGIDNHQALKELRIAAENVCENGQEDIERGIAITSDKLTSIYPSEQWEEKNNIK